ncbi:oxidoreductase activity [Scheffersomyces stipitis CBS 6054]|uniref:Oxidoreductase activity n=1 Tax=Scheffersomyces stipitis (strain ATCC 58785 / CBS 6054 / NBRC 10063 / NRRL Y-11545) TaxID=322104 RepID=A3GHA6_PICST|nr:oxidoreductase activity [Scheffersomyces stipitis CBS 6054]EAZ63022.1 oxidoreductase activity [Scheffersomyces stipitis CBS 6054]
MAPVRYTNPNTVYSRVEDEDADHEGYLSVAKEFKVISKAPDYLPTWNKAEKYEPLQFQEHIDAGTKADPALPNLFNKGTEFKTKNITPKLGTEVFGVQLSQLDSAGKDELALFVAKRGLVVFRDQDLASKGPAFQTELGRHFGPLHIHPTSGAPKDHPELHVVYRRPDVKDLFEHRNNLVGFHSDVTYELQPPGTTFLAVVEGPESGGDTLFADTVEAYNRLSPEFQKRLEGLHVLHSAVEQANFSRKNGGVVKRDPVQNIHPLVRTHPVTGEKALFINSGFSRKIVELKEEESDYLLTFLLNHINNSHDLQARAKWEANTVVVWDNRRVVHSAILDWDTSEARLAYRITPQAERPVYDLKDLNTPDENKLYKGPDYQ